MSSSIYPFCAWMLINHSYLCSHPQHARDSTGAPHHEKRDANGETKLQHMAEIQGSYTPLHPISIPTAAEQWPTCSSLWWVLWPPCAPGLFGLGWEGRADIWLIFGWETTSRGPSIPKWEWEWELSPVDISGNKSCQWQKGLSQVRPKNNSSSAKVIGEILTNAVKGKRLYGYQNWLLNSSSPRQM